MTKGDRSENPYGAPDAAPAPRYRTHLSARKRLGAFCSLAFGLMVTCAASMLLIDGIRRSIDRISIAISFGMILVGAAMILQALRELMPLSTGRVASVKVPQIAAITGFAIILIGSRLQD